MLTIISERLLRPRLSNRTMGSEKKRKRKDHDTDEKKKRKHKKADNIDKDPTPSDEVMVDGENETYLSPIARPLAGRKLTKRVFKLLGAAATAKALKRGVKEVVLAIRKGDTGVVVLAGDVFPIDVIAHVPILCEESNIPYCFVGRKTELGTAGLTNRPTSVAMVSQKKAPEELTEHLQEVREEVRSIQNLY
ncbi:Ribosomal protein L7Ae/L30e/S12e/Gadd45 [Gracilaria domingensis]|nr:Ribosomal protein L7Ae/L30e/S12e/Gadd45 [Gracilaria domingensis]